MIMKFCHGNFALILNILAFARTAGLAKTTAAEQGAAPNVLVYTGDFRFRQKLRIAFIV